MFRKRLRLIKFGSIGLALALVATLVIISLPTKVSISQSGFLALSSDVALTMQDDSPEPQETIESTFGKGGLPIRSIEYNTNGYILHVEFNGLAPLSIAEKDILDWSSVEAVEATMNSFIEEHLGGAGYGVAHVYSLEPLKFTTKLSNEKIEGEWWN